MADVEAAQAIEAGKLTGDGAEAVPAVGWSDEERARPTQALPIAQLLQISLYWLGINAIWGGMGVAIPQRVSDMVPLGEKGTYLAIQGFIILWVNILVQPTIGMISDYTQSRWGRRKPYIAIGATLDVVFIIGVATANTYLALVAFLFALQFSSNFAQGPFQGYVPDLVPEAQVGTASALVGAMQTLGFIIGGVLMSVGYLLGPKPDFTVPTIALGVIEFLTAIGTVLWVREGGVSRDRHGRSWREIAALAWGTDILRERSFVFLVLSRLMFLAGVNVLTGSFVLFMNQTLRPAPEERTLILDAVLITAAVVTATATIPSGRISDRVGRKPVIYVATVIGAIGLLVIAGAPDLSVVLVGAAMVGVASGTFLAVDWALMTDIIPKAASGRYMGISNIAVAGSGALAGILVGPIIDVVGGGKLELPEGPRVAFAAGVIFFGLAAVFLHWVDPRRREVRLAAEASAAPSTGTSPA